MRFRILALAALLFSAAWPAFTQTQTAVSATVTDPNGIPYANGRFSIQLIPSGTNPSVNGAAIQGAFNGATDATGSFSISLWPNASITPASTQWSFTVCSNPGGIQPPLGTGTQCTPATAITISGTAQVLSTTLSNVAPKLTNFAAGSGTVTNVSGTAPIVSSGGATPAISCPTCNTSGATIAGSIATNQVGFGTGANTLGGSASFLWTPSGTTGTFALANTTAATNVANQSGPTATVAGNYWTGAASAADTFTIADQVGAGTNPGTILNFSHSGSPSGGSYNFTGPVNVTAALTAGSATIAPGQFLALEGATSGTAASVQFGVPATIASTFRMNFPAAVAAQPNQVLASDGGTPTSTLSWIGPVTGINTASPSLPFGTDSGVANAYVVNPFPSVPFTAGQTSCFNFTTTNASTGASTMNASGTGVKTLVNELGGAMGANTILANTVYGACSDGTRWVLVGNGVTPATTLNSNGTLSLIATTGTEGAGAPLILYTSSPAPAAQSLLTMCQTITTNRCWFFDVDNDGSIVTRGQGGVWTWTTPFTFFSQPAIAQNQNAGGNDLLINPSPGGAKTSGNAIAVENNGAPILFNIDSVTGRPSSSGAICNSAASPAVCGGKWVGHVVIAAAATTVVVNTTAVTAQSSIQLTEDETQGTNLSVTCNTQSGLVLGTLKVTAVTAGASFTIGVDVAPTTNPMCIDYTITN